MTPAQLELIKKDYRELGNYIQRLRKRGKNDLAYKMECKQKYMESTISELNIEYSIREVA